jgi:uncharacterized membrane protein YphA (DoxX/SURF4 family)
MAQRDRQSAALSLALVRVVTGLILLRGGRAAAGQAASLAATIEGFVREGLEQRSGPLRTWSRSVLLENPDALAFLWHSGLSLVGLALLFGALVRPACGIAAVFVLHGWWFGPSTSHALHLLLLACFAALAGAGAGSTLGVDGILDRTLPRWLTWAPRRRRDDW